MYLKSKDIFYKNFFVFIIHFDGFRDGSRWVGVDQRFEETRRRTTVTWLNNHKKIIYFQTTNHFDFKVRIEFIKVPESEFTFQYF